MDVNNHLNELLSLFFILFYFLPPGSRDHGVTSKIKNRPVKWLHVWVVRESQKALAIKNGIISLHGLAWPAVEKCIQIVKAENHSQTVQLAERTIVIVILIYLC